MRIPIPATARAWSEILATTLVGAVAATAVAGVNPDRATLASVRHDRTTAFAAPSPVLGRLSNGQACPLTLAEEHKASLAFEAMMPVLTHPRCLNCHGGINEKLPFKEGGHMGDDVTDPDDCKDCHRGVRNLLRPGRLADWSTPPSVFFFKGKSSLELCNQFKEVELRPEKFVGHMTNENGGVQFAEAAYQGDRNLNDTGQNISRATTGRDMVPEPPPIPRSELIAHAREWATTVGTAGWKIRDCGCRLGGHAWTGKISAVFTGKAEGFGTITERLESTVRFEIDSSYILNAPEDTTLYWKTTSGQLKWTVTATGGTCTTNSTGSAPIKTGGDDNPWGLIRMHPDSKGALVYDVGIGPWPDAYAAQYFYKCKGDPQDYQLGGIMYSGGLWWQTGDDATVGADGKTMKGTHVMPHPIGETRWVWELTLVR